MTHKRTQKGQEKHYARTQRYLELKPVKILPPTFYDEFGCQEQVAKSPGYWRVDELWFPIHQGEVLTTSARTGSINMVL